MGKSLILTFGGGGGGGAWPAAILWLTAHTLVAVAGDEANYHN